MEYIRSNKLNLLLTKVLGNSLLVAEKVLGNNLLPTKKVLGNKISCPSMSSVTILGKQKQSSFLSPLLFVDVLVDTFSSFAGSG